MSREILTIQGGKYANYCGAHFWNIQELSFSYDEPKCSSNEEGRPAPDVLYREGLSEGRVTFTPRLLLLDSRDSLGTLSRSGGLPQPQASASCDWYQFETIKEPARKKNRYLKYIDGEDNDNDNDNDNQDEQAQSEESDIKVEPEEVNTWTDYLYARFHPRTVNLVNTTYMEENSVYFTQYTLFIKY